MSGRSRRAPAPPPESVSWELPPDLPGVMFVKVADCDRHWQWHHETWSLSTMYDGGGEWTCDRRTYELLPGQMSLWQPGDFHRVTRLYRCHESGHALTTQRCIFIDPAVVERQAGDLGLAPSGLCLKNRDVRNPATFRSFRRLYESLERPSTALERQSRFVVCLQVLLEGYLETGRALPDRGDESDAVSRAQAHLRERYAEPVTLDDLAAVTGLDRFRLLRTFKAKLAITPHAYQIQLRVQGAMELLRRGAPAADAAAAVGFVDQSHLTRQFRRHVRTTPGRFGAGS